jgi:hypothetical protein
MPKDVVTPRGDIIVSPTFNLVFITVVALTIVSGAAATALAFAADGSHANQQSIFESMNFALENGSRRHHRAARRQGDLTVLRSSPVCSLPIAPAEWRQTDEWNEPRDDWCFPGAGPDRR